MRWSSIERSTSELDGTAQLDDVDAGPLEEDDLASLLPPEVPFESDDFVSEDFESDDTEEA